MDILKIFLIINLSIVLASCSNSVVVKIDKDKRIITRELKNGKIKTINQKFNSLFNQWFDAECASKETSFAKCGNEEIIYTKLATIKIKEMQRNLGSKSNEKQSSSNEEQSSSNEKQSSSNEEQSSSNEENNNFADNDSPDGNDDAPEGHSPLDGHPPAD
jgi:hypothetical protein